MDSRLTWIASIVVNFLRLLYYWLESMVLALIPKRLRHKDVSGQVVLITGAGSGIGRLLALRFADLGAQVVIWDLDEKGAHETTKIIKSRNGTAFSYQCDVSKREMVYEVASKVKAEVGKVDILVNNAGVVTGKRFLECPDHMIQRTFEVNAMAHFWTCKAFLPDMMSENSGHLVSIASMAGFQGMERLSDYCASKYAAVGFEETVRYELHSEGYTGIHSTVVCPYFIRTGMFEGTSSGFMSMLTPEYVADEIVSSVLVNQEVVMLPKVFILLIILKSLFPSQCTREAMCSLHVAGQVYADENDGHVKDQKVVEDQNQNYEDIKVKSL